MSGKVEMKNLKNDLDRSKSLCARRVTLLKKLQNYDFLKKQAEEISILTNFEFKLFSNDHWSSLLLLVFI
jgi:hypothetical protein